MVQIPVRDHLVQIRLIHGHLEPVKVNDIGDLRLGKTVDLPEYLLKAASVHRHSCLHQLLRHVYGSPVHRQSGHIQRLQHVHVRGYICK